MYGGPSAIAQLVRRKYGGISGGLGMSGIASSINAIKSPPKKEESDDYDGNLMLSDDEKPKQSSPKANVLVR